MPSLVILSVYYSDRTDQFHIFTVRYRTLCSDSSAEKFRSLQCLLKTQCYTIHLWRNSGTLITNGISGHSAQHMLGGYAFGAMLSLSVALSQFS